MCQVLGGSKSGYHDWKNRKPSERILKRDGLKKHIYQIYIKSQGDTEAPKSLKFYVIKGIR
ncbi:hypothetical protein PYH66_09310 [Staphylococcus delphini]